MRVWHVYLTVFCSYTHKKTHAQTHTHTHTHTHTLFLIAEGVRDGRVWWMGGVADPTTAAVALEEATPSLAPYSVVSISMAMASESAVPLSVLLWLGWLEPSMGDSHFFLTESSLQSLYSENRSLLRKRGSLFSITHFQPCFLSKNYNNNNNNKIGSVHTAIQNYDLFPCEKGLFWCLLLTNNS